MLISDYAGKSSLSAKAEEFHIKLPKKDPKAQELLATLKDLENQGYQFEGAEGSFELLMRRMLGKHKPSFELLGFRVIVEKRRAGEDPLSAGSRDVEGGSPAGATLGMGPRAVHAPAPTTRQAVREIHSA